MARVYSPFVITSRDRDEFWNKARCALLVMLISLQYQQIPTKFITRNDP